MKSAGGFRTASWRASSPPASATITAAPPSSSRPRRKANLLPSGENVGAVSMSSMTVARSAAEYRHLEERRDVRVARVE